MSTQTLRGRARSWFDGTRSRRGPALASRLRQVTRALARRLPGPLTGIRTGTGTGPGRPAIRERPHTLLLGWSDELLAVLPELVDPGPDRPPGCLTILADRDRAVMAGEVRARVGGGGGRARVVCHRGNPTDPDEIARVNPGQAGSVIILPAADTPADRDAHLVKALLAVNRGPAGAAPVRVVGSVSDPANLPAARLAGGSGAHLLDGTGLTARLIAQTCLQPGLPLVYAGLLSPGGDEIQVREEPALVGHTYGQAMHAYRAAAVIGLQTAAGELTVNPHGQTPIRAGDRVVAISPDPAALARPAGPAPVAQPAILAYPDPPPGRTRTLLLGWNARATRLLGQLDQHLPPGSEVSVVARHPGAVPALGRLTGRFHNLVLTFKEDDGTDRQVLESLGVDSYHHVVVLSGDLADRQLADSRTLTAQLHLWDLAQPPGTGRFSVVCELADHRNSALARITGAEDVVASERLLSLLVARIAGDPARGAAFASLFGPDGPAVHLKPADRYVRTGQPVNFQTVVEAARWRWETAIGYRVSARSHQPPSHGVVLNPDKAAPLTLLPHDQVVVLAET